MNAYLENRRLCRRRYPLLPPRQVACQSRLVSPRNDLAEVQALTQPFLPLFFGDFLASTAEWSGEERALYLLCLAYQWSMGSLPTDPKRLAKLVDYERRLFDASWDTVSKKFVERDGRLYNLRLEQHRKKSLEVSNKRAIAGANGAAKRWQKDGNNHESGNGNGIAIATTLSSHPSHPILNPKSKSRDPAPQALDSDPRKQIFDLGKTLLGENSGGLISKAISNTDEATVGAVLGEMALKPKADPRAYFAAATERKQREVVC